MLANIIEVFQNVYHITYIDILLKGVKEYSEAYSETLQTSKMEYFCISS